MLSVSMFQSNPFLQDFAKQKNEEHLYQTHNHLVMKSLFLTAFLTTGISFLTKVEVMN